jgi:hypothetical protein
LVPYLPRIIPSLFNLVGQVTKGTASTEEGDSEAKYHTYEAEEAEVAISMLDVFIDKLGQNFSQYVEEATKVKLISPAKIKIFLKVDRSSL